MLGIRLKDFNFVSNSEVGIIHNYSYLVSKRLKIKVLYLSVIKHD